MTTKLVEGGQKILALLPRMELEAEERGEVLINSIDRQHWFWIYAELFRPIVNSLEIPVIPSGAEGWEHFSKGYNEIKSVMLCSCKYFSLYKYMTSD